jgi:hypothetical protein
MRALPIAGLVAALAVACAPSRPDDAGGGARADAGGRPLFPDGSPPPPRADAGVCEEVVDLVFVLDTSSSMGFVLSELEAQIGSVVSAANGLAPDAHFGLVVFQDDVWIDATGPLSGGVVHTSASALQSAFYYYRDTFTRWDRNPGDGPGGPTRQNPICEENALDALHLAADRFPWRDNATRVIILATDDTFLERPDNYGDRDGDGATNRTDFPREGDYPAAHTLAETLARLRAERIRVFSFTRLAEPGIFDRCGTPRRFSWSAIRWGWSAPYQGQAPIPEQTDATNFDIDRVQDGSLNLAQTINEVVLESYCVPPVQ